MQNNNVALSLQHQDLHLFFFQLSENAVPQYFDYCEENYGNESHDERDLKKRHSKSSPKKLKKKQHLNNKDEAKNHYLRCIFCNRKYCDDCPLPFDDKITLRKYLDKCKASNQSKFYYMDDEDYNEKRN